jgi:hypothetical protein
MQRPVREVRGVRAIDQAVREVAFAEVELSGRGEGHLLDFGQPPRVERLRRDNAGTAIGAAGARQALIRQQDRRGKPQQRGRSRRLGDEIAIR